MADLERGQRIKARREELHLTQPAVVDLIEEAAEQLPKTDDLHPERAGKAPVSLRGYQTYERGGGIVWAKAKLLARVLQMDVQTMMQGPSDDEQETPDPFASTGQDAVMDRLDAIDERLGRIERLLGERTIDPAAIEATRVLLREALERRADPAVAASRP